jgi:hypothetical protein
MLVMESEVRAGKPASRGGEPGNRGRSRRSQGERRPCCPSLAKYQLIDLARIGAAVRRLHLLALPVLLLHQASRAIPSSHESLVSDCRLEFRRTVPCLIGRYLFSGSAPPQASPSDVLCKVVPHRGRRALAILSGTDCAVRGKVLHYHQLPSLRQSQFPGARRKRGCHEEVVRRRTPSNTFAVRSNGLCGSVLGHLSVLLPVPLVLRTLRRGPQRSGIVD